MAWEEVRKKGFWKFPVLDALAALTIAVISLVLSLFDETAAFGIPALVGALGFYSFYQGLTSGKVYQFLYGIRAIVICLSATFLVLIVWGDYITAAFLVFFGAVVYIGVIAIKRIVKKESVRT